MTRITLAVVTTLLLAPHANSQTGLIRTVFMIVLENHDWSSIRGNSAAPYINNELLPRAAHAEAYYNPPGIHPSLPNYLWLEAGTNFGISDDGAPSAHHWASDHFAAQLAQAGISWKAYMEDIPGTSCPLTDQAQYTTQHNPFVYFDDVTDGNNSASAFCVAHVRPYSEFAADLQNNAVAGYNFIAPNLCHDMHNCDVSAGDAWLSTEVPRIVNSQPFQDGGVLFITWDEGAGNDGPIGMIVLSPYAKWDGYASSIYFTHASTLRTLQEIFGLQTFLGGAASANDLSDLFSVPLGPVGLAPKIANAASYMVGGVAPGEIVSIFGTGIGPNPPTGLTIDGAGLVPDALGGVQVLFDTIPAPMLYAGPSQLNLVVPFEVAGKTNSTMQIEYQGQVLWSGSLSVVAAAPAFFTQDASGTGLAAALNQDGSVNSPTNPAASGSIISLFGTGAGQMNPASVDGQLAGSDPARPLQPVSATIGGVPAQVTYAGPAPGLVFGVLQLNLKIPAGTPPGDAVPIMATIGPGSTQVGAAISVR